MVSPSAEKPPKRRGLPPSSPFVRRQLISVISSLLSHPMCAAPGLMWAWMSPCVVAESSRCQVDPKKSTRNQVVAPCLFFRGMGMESIRQVRLGGCTRGGVWYFLLGPTESLNRRKGANEGTWHRERVWYLCNVTEMWQQGTSLQLSYCRAFPSPALL